MARTRGKRKGKLPEKASALIRVALKDLRKAEQSPRYVVDMGTWHEPLDNKCEVCLGGSVICGTLKVEPTDMVSPDAFSKKVENKLYALDQFRTGQVEEAYRWLNRPRPHGIAENLEITRYPDRWSGTPKRKKAADRKKFHRELGRLANMLEAAGD